MNHLNQLNQYFSGKSLQDVVKGLRSQPTAEGRSAYAAQALQECRVELASVDPALKANAASKVAHLRMLGFDVHNIGDDDTSFHVIEVMASPQFKHKRLGNLAAARILSPQSRVLLLATNSLKKELNSADPYVAGLALGSVSCFVSRDLARDLLPDVTHCLQSSKPYVRKRAMLCVLRLCQAYPEGLLDAYDAMRSRLDDADAGVVGCAVNVVCELSRSNARSVLPLTPQLFALLTSSSNNWMLIKIVKLYSALIAVEPRLARKLLDPLARIIRTTSAKSLLYECVATVTRAIPHCPTAPAAFIHEIVLLCAQKLKQFVLDSDQNLKYLGLVGFIELTKSHPTIASEYKDMIVLCLGDDDVAVRLRALELLAGIATPKSVAGIVKCVLEVVHRSRPGPFRDAVAPCVIQACVGADNDLSRLPSCEWYFSVLIDLARASHAHSALLASQLVGLAISVPSVQPFASETAAKLVFESDVAPEVFAAAAFVACEYETQRSAHDTLRLVERLLDDNQQLPELERATLIHNAVKLARASGNPHLLARTRELLEPWAAASASAGEVQERAVLGLALLAAPSGGVRATPLVPVHATAQLQVPLPLGLDLTASFLPAAENKDAPASSSVAALSFRGRRALVPTQSLASSAPKASPFYLSPSSPGNATAAATTMYAPLVDRHAFSQNSGDNGDNGGGDDDDDDRRAATAATSKLWSSSVGVGQGHGGAVVMAPALPVGAVPLSTRARPQADGEGMTLADIDVYSARPATEASIKAYPSPLVAPPPSTTHELVDERERAEEHGKKKKKKKKASSSSSARAKKTKEHGAAAGASGREEDLIQW